MRYSRADNEDPGSWVELEEHTQKGLRAVAGDHALDQRLPKRLTRG